MFWRILVGSLRNRRNRILMAWLAVVLGSSLVSALASVSLEVGSRVGKELRVYGANILVAPKASTVQTGVGGMEFGAATQEKYLAGQDVEAIKSRDGAGEVVAYAPYLYGIVEAAGKKVVLAGVHFQAVREVSPWWKVTGDWAPDGEPAKGMVGANVARDLGLSPGGEVLVRYGSKAERVEVAGIVETGGSEENQIFLPLAPAQTLLERPNAVSVVQVSALSSGRPLKEVAQAVEEWVPGSQAKVIGQIAEAEVSILAKVQLLMALIALLVLLASGLALASTMAASMLERTREIGLMKALGAGDRRIAGLFMAETAAIAVIGGATGYLVGLGLAEIIGETVFNSAIAPSLLAALATLFVALAMCLLASAVPIRRALAIDPAITLKGE
ncbi:MAG: ABC transporter permease [Chloroflexi bacterium]|nr:ABC transporter permease [Chloroflexota bacterium]